MADDVDARLTRWKDAGLIDAEQVEAIGAFERRRPAAREGQDDRRSLVAEIAGYVGAALAVIAGGILLGEVWDQLRPWAQVTLLAVVSGVLLAAGAVLRRRTEPAVSRLVGVLWLLAVVGAAATAGVAADRALGREDAQIALVVSGAGTLLAAVLYRVRRRALQQIPLAIGLCATAISAVLLPRAEVDGVWIGLLLWSIGVAWMLLVAGGMIVPPVTGMILAILAMGVGGQTAAVGTHQAAGLVGSLATCGVLLWLSVTTRTPLLAGFALFGLFVFVPQAVFHFLGDSLGAPLALLVSGLLLVGGAVGALTIRREAMEGVT